MTFLRSIQRLARDRRAATAAEFALVLPLLLLLMFGIIDGGRLLWEVNRAEKATQMGARFAIVTNVIPAELVAEDYVGSAVCNGDTCTQGDMIDDPTALGTLRCDEEECVCTGTCPAVTSLAGFQQLVDYMKLYDPSIAEENVVITFRGSGIGYAGDPTGMDVVPLVTVELDDLEFIPISSFALASVTLPSFRTTLSAESSVGTQSN